MFEKYLKNSLTRLLSLLLTITAILTSIFICIMVYIDKNVDSLNYLVIILLTASMGSKSYQNFTNAKSANPVVKQ